MLGSLPMLEVFRGVSLFRDPEGAGGGPGRMDENDERACDILNICPRIRQVEHWDLEPARAIALERRGDRVVWWVEVVEDHNTDEGFPWWTWNDVIHVVDAN